MYSQVQFSLLNIGLGRFLFNVFLIMLLTRWGVDFLSYGVRGPTTSLQTFMIHRLKIFLQLFRIIVLVDIFVVWITGSISPLTWMVRNVLLLILLIWTFMFWRSMKPVVAEGLRLGQAAPNFKKRAILQGFSYLVIKGSPIQGSAMQESSG
jgi:hypothetical protein